MTTFYRDDTTLYDPDGNPFDPATIHFLNSPTARRSEWRKLSAREAVHWLQKREGRIRPPIAVVGPREATASQVETAYKLGLELAGAGLSVLCGGRQGVMEAVCRGVRDGGGISIGLLPDDDWSKGNPYSTVPIATGIGIARNALISRAAHVMVAVGAGLGTISELALGLQFGKRVFAISDHPIIDGVRVFPDWERMEPFFYEAVLGYGDKA